MEKKYEMHVPVEQYGYISCTLEGTAEQAVEEYREIANLVKVQPKGLPDKDFRDLYDKMYRKEAIAEDPGVWYEMNPQQQFAANELKKAIKRNNK